MPGGLIICEVDPTATRHQVHTMVLRTPFASSSPIAWSRIGVSALLQVAASLDLLPVEEWMSGERAFVSLRSISGSSR